MLIYGVMIPEYPTGPHAPGEPPPVKTLVRTALALLLALACQPTPAFAQAPDFSAWQQLLDRYARQVSAKGEPIQTRFDYEQLYVDDKIYRTHQSMQLAVVRQQMFALAPEAMKEADRTAWAINSYNFLVVERITLWLLVPARKFLRYKSVAEMTTPEGAFFDVPVVTLSGREYTLAQFERAFVQRDSVMPPQRRSRANDPRILFALCSGANGDPTLWLQAFRGDLLETQLDRVTRNAMASPQFVRVSEKKDDISVSNGLFTRRFDMGGDGADIIRFITKYGTNNARAVIRKYKLINPPFYFPVDGLLNQVERPKTTAPEGALPDSTRGM